MKKYYSVLIITLILFVSLFTFLPLNVSGYNIYRSYMDDNQDMIATSTSGLPVYEINAYKTFPNRVIYNMPIFIGNYIFIGCDDGKLYCLNRADLSEVWNYTASGKITSTPIIDTRENNKLYFGDVNDKLYKLDLLGNEIWNVTISNGQASFGINSILALDEAYNGTHLVVYADNGRVHGVNTSNGHVDKTIVFGNNLDQCDMAQGNGVVIMSSMSGLAGIKAISATDLSDLWVISSIAVGKGVVIQDETEEEIGEWVFYCRQYSGASHSIQKRYLSNGTQIWKRTITPTQSVLTGFPIIFEDYLYYTTSDGKIHALNKNTGWWREGTNNVTIIDGEYTTDLYNQGVVTDSGLWYILDQYSTIHVINLYTFEVYRTIDLDDTEGLINYFPCIYNVEEPDNFLYVCNDKTLYRIGASFPPDPTILEIKYLGSVINPYVTLGWDIAESILPILHYHVYRSYDNITFEHIATLASTTVSYTDYSIEAYIYYYYYVTSENQAGESESSNIVSLIITTASGLTEDDTGIVGDMLSIITIIGLGFFVSLLYARKFSLPTFLVFVGMGIAVLCALQAISIEFVVITVLLYGMVFYMKIGEGEP